MISKNSFYKLLRNCLKDSLWAIAVVCIMLFFSLPIYGAISASSIVERVMCNLNLLGRESFMFAANVLGEYNVFLRVMVSFAAVILAFNAFGFLYDKAKVDFYHSLPIKRDTYFAARYLSGVFIYVVVYVGFLAVTLLVGTAYGMLSAIGIKAALVMILINLLSFLGIYNTAIIAIYLTGTKIVGVIATVVLTGYLSVIRLLWIAFESTFYVTYSPYGEYDTLPLSFVEGGIALTRYMDSFNGVIDVRFKSIAIYVFFLCVSLAIAFALCKLRASEVTGKSMAFKKTMAPVSILILIPATLFGGMGFWQLTGGEYAKFGWFVFGFVLTLVLGHVIIQAVYYLDFKSIMSDLYNPIIAGAVAAVIACVFAFDITGYDSYIPDESAYESAAITSYSMQGNIEYFDFDANMDQYGNKQYILDQMMYRLDNIKITDKALVRDFVGAAIEDTKALEEYRKSVDDMDSYYQKAGQYTNVYVRYNAIGNRQVHRTYNIMLSDHMNLYDRLYACEDYKKIVCPMLTLDPADANNIRYADMLGTLEVRFSDEDMVGLVSAYRKDVQNHSAYSLRDEVPYGYLFKEIAVRDASGFAQTFYDKKAYIYPSFTNTLEILKKYDIDLSYYKNPENIAKVVINDYNELKDNGEPISVEYTNRADIAKIMESAYPFEMIGMESVTASENSIDVNVFFKNLPVADYGYSYGYSYIGEEVPSFIKDAIKAAK